MLEWLVEERLPGRPLIDAWMGLSAPHRHSVIADLARLLARLQRSTARPPRADFGAAVVTGIRRSLTALETSRPHDGAVWRALLAAVDKWGAAFDDESETVLVHNDLQFNNILVDGARITGVVDFGRARWAPAELELDLLTRFTCYPWLFVPEPQEAEARVHADQMGEVAEIFVAAYPALSPTPARRKRLLLYALSYDLASLAKHPDLVGEPARHLPWARVLEALGGPDGEG
jgi:aminoglycoside phosphotransferase (APT) family kinase protein